MNDLSYLFYKLVNGGAEHGGIRLIDLLRNNKYHVNIFLVRPHSEPNFVSIYFYNFFTNLTAFRSSRNIISSVSYASLFACFFKGRIQNHYVWLHNTNYSFVHEFIFRIIDSFFDVTFIADSIQTKNVWIKKFRNSIKKVPIFYFRDVSNSQPDYKVSVKKEIVSVVRPTNQKGLKRLLILSKLLPDYSFYLYGISFEELNLFGFVSSNIECEKFSEPQFIYDSRRLFVLTSKWEGLSLATLEAIDSGMVCFSTKVGEIPFHLNSDDSYLVENDDSDELVAEALKFKIEDVYSNIVIHQEKFKNIREFNRVKYSEKNVLSVLNGILK